jgi:hypothetical protein
MFNKKIIYLFLLTGLLALVTGCGVNEKNEVPAEEEKAADDYTPEQVVNTDIIPLNFNTIKGNWDLKYGADYGYSFRLGNNYRAVVILYLSSSSVIFRGVYTIEEDDLIRINISEMKREDRVKGINTNSGFTKVKSSYFIFHSRLFEKEGKTIMELRPVRIFIDNNSSDGYIEPLIRLVKRG